LQCPPQLLRISAAAHKQWGVAFPGVGRTGEKLGSIPSASSQHFIGRLEGMVANAPEPAPKVPVVGVDQNRVDGAGGIGKRKEQRLVMDEAPAWRREFVEVVNERPCLDHPAVVRQNIVSTPPEEALGHAPPGRVMAARRNLTGADE